MNATHQHPPQGGAAYAVGTPGEDPNLDVCVCGDARHQHSEHGCRVCRKHPLKSVGRCRRFRKAEAQPYSLAAADWLAEVRRLFAELGYEFYGSDGGWREYFDGRYAPKEAILEDLSYA